MCTGALQHLNLSSIHDSLHDLKQRNTSFQHNAMPEAITSMDDACEIWNKDRPVPLTRSRLYLADLGWRSHFDLLDKQTLRRIDKNGDKDRRVKNRNRRMVKKVVVSSSGAVCGGSIK